jgi:hypothetical protein
MPGQQGDRFDFHVGGDVTGQLAVGRDIAQYRNEVRSTGPVTGAELDELRAAFAALRARLDAETGAEADIARQKLDELAEAVTAEKPDLSTMEHVRGWFQRKLPALAGAVGRLVVSPVVTKLVAAAGDDLAAEFTRRFGG